LVVEVGGWGAILGFVRDGLGVGVVSEGALDDTAGLTVRTLDPSVFPPIESKMICRRASASGDDLDLSETALAWRDALRREARDPVGSKR
jgi:DNA-binding transcriptional LysR family regulator